MSISIIKIKCPETNKIFIAHTKNIKLYMKHFRRSVRNKDRSTFMPVLHHMTDKVSYELLDKVEDNKINQMRNHYININPECINVRDWKPNKE
tara:strand:+ start:314 stop:592 length:279 start_codon:yes stop_codon:yes gene_type:complete